MSTETQRTERKLTFVIDDDALFNADKGQREGEASGNFLELATALAQRKWFILKMTAAAGIIGLVVALLLPNWYTANTKILPPQQQQSAAAALMSSLAGNSAMGSLASVAGGALGIKGTNDLYIGMLKSRPVRDAIIKRFDLQKLYGARDVYAARKKLANYTEITWEKEGFIGIAVEDKDRKRAEEMADAYVEELRNLTKGMAVTEAAQRRFFFEQQLKQAKDDLANAEVALTLAQHKSGVIQVDAQTKSIIESISNMRARIAAKHVEVQALRSFATDQNPQLDLAQRELAALQGELKMLEKKGDKDSYEVALKDVPQAAVEYIRAAREVKYRETLFEIFARQYEAARVDEAKDAPLIQVVEPAIEPERKSFPKVSIFAVVAALAGFVLACVILLAGRWGRSLYQDDPQKAELLKAFRAAFIGR